MNNAVGTEDEEVILTPSSVVSGTAGGGYTVSEDTPGMKVLQADRMIDDVVDNTRVSTVMLPDTDVKEEDDLSQNTSLMTMPSVGDEGYPCNTTTSKNFTIHSNPIVSEVATVDESATQPDEREDDDRSAKDMKEEPTQVMTMSSQTQRKCVHSKKEVCAVHGPGAKWKWKPGTKKVTGEDGVTRLERTKIHYWRYDLGPEGRGVLKQTRISGFLTTAWGEREGSLTVGDRTLLGPRTTLTEGQGSSADTIAGFKRNVGGC